MWIFLLWHVQQSLQKMWTLCRSALSEWKLFMLSCFLCLNLLIRLWKQACSVHMQPQPFTLHKILERKKKTTCNYMHLSWSQHHWVFSSVISFRDQSFIKWEHGKEGGRGWRSIFRGQDRANVSLSNIRTVSEALMGQFWEKQLSKIGYTLCRLSPCVQVPSWTEVERLHRTCTSSVNSSFVVENHCVNFPILLLLRATMYTATFYVLYQTFIYFGHVQVNRVSKKWLSCQTVDFAKCFLKCFIRVYTMYTLNWCPKLLLIPVCEVSCVIFFLRVHMWHSFSARVRPSYLTQVHMHVDVT